MISWVCSFHLFTFFLHLDPSVFLTMLPFFDQDCFIPMGADLHHPSLEKHLQVVLRMWEDYGSTFRYSTSPSEWIYSLNYLDFLGLPRCLSASLSLGVPFHLLVEWYLRGLFRLFVLLSPYSLFDCWPLYLLPDFESPSFPLFWMRSFVLLCMTLKFSSQ